MGGNKHQKTSTVEKRVKRQVGSHLPVCESPSIPGSQYNGENDQDFINGTRKKKENPNME